MSDLVSVVIVAYNKAETVEAAIRSVLNQTYPRTEVLVVDDGSTDDTASRVRTFGERVRYLHKENGGTGSARNLGIQEASGSYVAFLDGDDLWLPRKLEIQMKAFEREPSILAVQCSAHYADEKLRILETKICTPRRDSLRDFLLFRNLPAFASAVVIRRNVLLKLGGFATDLVILSDWDMVCRLSQAGRLRSIPEPLVLYRQYPNNQSRNVKIHLWSGVRSLRRFFRAADLDAEIRRFEPVVWGRFYAMLSGGHVRNGDWAKGVAWALKAVRTSPRLIPYIAGMPLRRIRKAWSRPSKLIEDLHPWKETGPLFRERKLGWLVGVGGLLMGGLLAWTPGGAFMFGLAAAVFFLLRRVVKPENRRFAAVLFAVSFCLRAALSLGLDVGSWWAEGETSRWTGPVKEWDLGIVDKSRMYLKIGDSDYYSARGYALSQYAQGVREKVVLFRINQYGWNGYVYVIGWFYRLFGYSPYAVKLLNCLLGALLGPLVFFIAADCFNPRVARWSALAVAFFPSMLLWSASNLKDIPLVFLTLTSLLLFNRLQREGQLRPALKYGLLLGLTLFLHSKIRTAAFTGILVAGLGLSYVLTRPRLKGWPVALFIAAALVGLYLEPLRLLVRRFLSICFNWHFGFVTTPGISYRFLPDPFYSSGYLEQWVDSGKVGLPEWIGMVKALVHYLIEPIPWVRQIPLPWTIWPQMALWYVALMLSAGGGLWALRRRYHQTLFLLVTLVLWTTVSALSSGNVGTVFRIRDMVTPLYLMFACMGAWLLQQKIKGRAPT